MTAVILNMDWKGGWYGNVEECIAEVLLRYRFAWFSPSRVTSEARRLYAAKRYGDFPTLRPADMVQPQSVNGFLRRLVARGGAQRGDRLYQLTPEGLATLEHRLDRRTQVCLNRDPYAIRREGTQSTGHLREPGQTEGNNSMCIEAHPHRGTPGVDRDLPTAKVFLEGKDRPLFISDPPAAEIRREFDNGAQTVEVFNLDGEATLLLRERVVSVVTPKPRKSRVEADGMVWDGDVPCTITVRSLRAFNDAQVENESPFYAVTPENGVEGYVAVESLHGDADALVVAVHPATGHIAWANPAVSERSMKRYVKAAKALTEAEVLDEQENQPEPREVESPTIGQDSRVVVQGGAYDGHKGKVQQTLAGGEFLVLLENGSMPSLPASMLSLDTESE